MWSKETGCKVHTLYLNSFLLGLSSYVSVYFYGSHYKSILDLFLGLDILKKESISNQVVSI